MINLDSLTIKAFLQENYDFFIGAKIQKVQQPNRREIIFQLRNGSESRKFYININPSFYHVCFMSKQNEVKRRIKIPKAAAMFCMLLRKYIDGSRIVEVKQPNYERIIEFYFDVYDALNEKSRLCLSIELMGKHSNIILYNYDTNVIIGCAHNVGSEKSKDRELAGLLPYIYPPKQKKKDILKTDFEKFYSIVSEDILDLEGSISDSFYYFSRPLVSQIYKALMISDNPSKDDFSNFFNVLQSTAKLESVCPNIDNDFDEFSIYKNDVNIVCDSVNSMLDDYFSFHQTQKIILNIKNKLRTIINNQIKKLSQIKEKQEVQLTQLDKANLYRKKGDVLMANLYKIESGLSKIELDDYETGDLLHIELDSAKSPVDNANRYYKLYKKTKSAYEYSKAMIEETVAQLEYYKEQLFYVELASSILELEEIQAELGIDNNSNKQAKDSKETMLDEYTIGGYQIIVGKNSKQNDYLLSKVASSEDIWFHPLNMAGSHVVLKKNNPKEIIPDEILFEAAKIAKEYSSGKLASKVPIIYTLRKYVKKATAKGLAFVTYKNETEILVD